MREGWQIKTLGEVCVTIQDGAHESPKLQFDSPGHGRFPYVTSKNIRNNHLDLDKLSYVDEEFHNRIYPRCSPSLGDVLLTKDGINTGNVTLNTLDEPFSLLSSVCLIKTAPSLLLPSFLSYFIQSPGGLQRITGQMTGDAIKRIILRDIKLAEIPVPPLPEQQRIVALLDDAFAGLATAKANAERNLQSARAIFECHLESVFNQWGEGWVEYALGDLIEIQNGYAFKSSEYVDSGYFVIRIGNVQDGEISLNNPRYIRLTDQRLERFVLEEGDILISLTGNIGRVGIIHVEHLPAVLNQRVARITVKNQSIDRAFLFRFLSSRAFREGLQEAGHGAAQQNVSTKEIESVLLSVPSRIEQRAAVDEFNRFDEEVDRLTHLYERKLAALEELKKSLLQQAFNGEL
jgi:type I restriction enzyme, S subunit